MAEKRKRSQNFTLEDKDKLLKLLLQHKHTILNKKTNGPSNEAKSNAWIELTNSFNSSGTTYRSKDSLIKVWEKMKSDSKIYYSLSGRNTLQTGGGPSILKTDPILEQVCNIMGWGCTDIAGVSDSDAGLIDVKMKAMPKVICIGDSQSSEIGTMVYKINITEEPHFAIRKTPLWFRRRPQQSQPNERAEAVAMLGASFKDVNKRKEDVEDLKRQLWQMEIDFKRKLYELQLQAAVKEVEIKNEILLQIKGSTTTTAAAAAATQGDVHEGFKCNTCKGAIVGFRYTCVECAEFDMCAACERREAHAYHYVLRVPGPRPYMEVRALVKKIRREVLKVVGPDDDSSDDESDDEPAGDETAGGGPDEIPKTEVKLEADAGPDPLQPHSEIVTAFDSHESHEVTEIKLEFESGDETEEHVETEAGAVTSTVSRQPLAATHSAVLTPEQRSQPQTKLWPVLEISQGLKVTQPPARAPDAAVVPDIEIKVELPTSGAEETRSKKDRPKKDSGTVAFQVFTHAKDSPRNEPSAGTSGGGGAHTSASVKRKPTARPQMTKETSAAKKKK